MLPLCYCSLVVGGSHHHLVVSALPLLLLSSCGWLPLPSCREYSPFVIVVWLLVNPIIILLPSCFVLLFVVAFSTHLYNNKNNNKSSSRKGEHSRQMTKTGVIEANDKQQQNEGILATNKDERDANNMTMTTKRANTHEIK